MKDARKDKEKAKNYIGARNEEKVKGKKYGRWKQTQKAKVSR